MTEPVRIGTIDLGLMGTALTERYRELGFQPCRWNRTAAKAGELLQAAAIWSNKPLAECKRVVISLFNSDVVHEVLSRMPPQARKSSILIDTTTRDPGAAELLAENLRRQEIAYPEAPIPAAVSRHETVS